jgi:hypothetical protein
MSEHERQGPGDAKPDKLGPTILLFLLALVILLVILHFIIPGASQ